MQLDKIDGMGSLLLALGLLIIAIYVISSRKLLGKKSDSPIIDSENKFVPQRDVLGMEIEGTPIEIKGGTAQNSKSWKTILLIALVAIGLYLVISRSERAKNFRNPHPTEQNSKPYNLIP